MDVKKKKGRVGNVDRKIIWAQQTPPGYLKPKNRFSQQMLQEFSTITLHLPLLHNDSLLFLCWNTVLIKELKIAVDGPEDTFENKLDEMGSVIFDYRGGKKKILKCMKRRWDSLRTKEVTAEEPACLITNEKRASWRVHSGNEDVR